MLPLWLGTQRCDQGDFFPVGKMGVDWQASRLASGSSVNRGRWLSWLSLVANSALGSIEIELPSARNG